MVEVENTGEAAPGDVGNDQLRGESVAVEDQAEQSQQEDRQRKWWKEACG